jgi:hypothetical protein
MVNFQELVGSPFKPGCIMTSLIGKRRGDDFVSSLREVVDEETVLKGETVFYIY